MANVLNRTTKQFLVSVNTPDFPVGQWIIEPDLSAVAGFSSIYWIITGDMVTLMSQPERDAVDAANLVAQRDSAVSAVDDLENLTRAVVLVIKDEINLLRAQHAFAPRTNAQLRAAIRNKLGDSNG